VIDMMLLYMLYRAYINEKKTLSSRAYSDFLTKLPNKRMFDKYVNNLPQNSSISIVVLDVDDFKSYNDLYGHQKGDVALEKIGAILNEHIQNNVIFFRVGGEEFAGLFVSKSHNQVRQVLESICLKLQDKSIEHDGNINHKIITLSIGVAWGKISTPLDVQSLYDHADKMLYTSKRQGKNRITFKESSV
ncbi:GGDEF domain-containing protein, partial [Vibrio aestuarianus]|uniref:GGDEF domain-containing protein n=1 Tax=Vibrio aestuarianus TaxID=28171 RepID=UPI00237CAEBD